MTRSGRRQVPPTRPEWLDVETKHALVAGVRCHARINLGAESLADIYFDDWELDGD